MDAVRLCLPRGARWLCKNAAGVWRQALHSIGTCANQSKHQLGFDVGKYKYSAEARSVGYTQVYLKALCQQESMQ